ncbi:hypothetical protein, partial [Faecalibaculum rodentium]|uniref:hypothetical protein n=1 Tax=Faecalibaculum rodentium TaxID=1702221 RepID=UPI003EBDF43E
MNPKIVKKLLSCYPELKSELSSTRRELRDVEHKKSDLAHPKAVSWDGAYSQNPVAQADILTGLISDEMDAAQRAAALEKLLDTLCTLRDRMEEPGRTLVTEKYGSPPRMRGQVFTVIPTLLPVRITPADAGTSQDSGGMESTSKDHPRGCGDKS